MTSEMWFVVILLFITIFLFVTEWLSGDIVALLVILALALSGTLKTSEVFAGFANSSVLTIVFLFIVGGAVMQTGLATTIGKQILKIAGGKEIRLLIVLMLATAILSAFMSNTGTIAVLLPAVVALAHQAKTSPSKLLIPLSFGSILGGMATLIGTPPNLLVNDTLREAGLPPFGFFSFLPIGLLLTVIIIVAVVLFGRNLLPDHQPQGQDDSESALNQLVEQYHLLENMRRLTISADSPLVGQTLSSARFRRDYQVSVLKIMRPSPHVRLSDIGHNIETRRPQDDPIIPNAETVLQAQDHLIVEGRIGNIARVAKAFNLITEEPKPKDTKALISKENGIAELIIRQRSHLIGKSLVSSNFANAYKVNVLEIRRPSRKTPLTSDDTLQFGDLLLVQGWWTNILTLKKQEQDLIVVGNPDANQDAPHSQQATYAFIILVAMIILMVWGKLPFIGEVDVVFISLIAAIAMILSGALTMDEAYHSIEWKSVVLIGGVLPIGTAMSKVGLMDLLANQLVNGLGQYGNYAVLIGIFLFTTILTQLMSNTATALLMAPLALASAQALQVNPQTLLMGVAVAASCAYVTPMASPTNMMVMGAGNYRFIDFVKIGLVMLLISTVVCIIALPIFFPF